MLILQKFMIRTCMSLVDKIRANLLLFKSLGRNIMRIFVHSSLLGSVSINSRYCIYPSTFKLEFLPSLWYWNWNCSWPINLSNHSGH